MSFVMMAASSRGGCPSFPQIVAYARVIVMEMVQQHELFRNQTKHLYRLLWRNTMCELSSRGQTTLFILVYFTYPKSHPTSLALLQ